MLTGSINARLDRLMLLVSLCAVGIFANALALFLLAVVEWRLR